MNKLDFLREMTVVVADTGDINSIAKFAPTDATTNPSLILKSSQNEVYRGLIRGAVDYAKSKCSGKDKILDSAITRVAVNFGREILKIIPGRVSSEVDARLSFDTESTVKKAREIIDMYRDLGINRERILIKIAATWEGIRAARQLEKENIHCNLTLLFSFAQAIQCADAGVTLISPYVGRILDWYKKNSVMEEYAPSMDPGVLSVKKIYNYYKKNGYKTIVMGASFRNVDQITELAGCDYLTISPELLNELKSAETEKMDRKLNKSETMAEVMNKITLDEKTFRWMHNEDAMATEKLAEGIRSFTVDTIKLEKMISQML